MTFTREIFEHVYYLNVKEDEIKFIDKLFNKVENKLSPQDKMLNYSISAIYTATVVLIELLHRNNIKYDNIQIEKNMCRFFKYESK